MSSDVAIRARRLGKAYTIFSRPEDRLKQMLVRGRRKYYREFWALRNVDLDVHRGETLGIVGRNGSGKSTFLQLACGILTPTTGKVRVAGRIAAMLELGAGFNPEFTGRENVMMNGAIMGLSQREIEDRFDSIAAFADIGEFLEQPVKTYSSGMYARLAFATAINVDPEILVVDEVLSVGDEAFRRKCFARINDIREAGATVLFVSHSAGSIVDLCNRAVLFDHGECVFTGEPKTVIGNYQRLIYAPPNRVEQTRDEIRRSNGKPALPPPAEPGNAGEELPSAAAAVDVSPETEQPVPEPTGPRAGYEKNLVPKSTQEYHSRGARILDARIEDLDGRRVNVLIPGQEYLYRYRVAFEEPASRVRLGMMIKTVTGIGLAGQVSHTETDGIARVPENAVLSVSFRFRNLFAPGAYFLNAGVRGIVDGEESFLHRILDVIMFRVDRTPGRTSTGLVDISSEPHCTVEVEAEASPLQKIHAP